MENKNNKWLSSLEEFFQNHTQDEIREFLEQIQEKAHHRGIKSSRSVKTPYINTIPSSQQPPYPGRMELERRIKSLIRWNAMSMVVRANRDQSGIGGQGKIDPTTKLRPIFPKPTVRDLWRGVVGDHMRRQRLQR